MLVKHGADLRAKDHYGYTAFYRAADQGHDEVARFLRDAMRKV
jgi:ankyrin repeat protein